jgi:hypothetical protein
MRAADRGRLNEATRRRAPVKATLERKARKGRKANLSLRA